MLGLPLHCITEVLFACRGVIGDPSEILKHVRCSGCVAAATLVALPDPVTSGWHEMMIKNASESANAKASDTDSAAKIKDALDNLVRDGMLPVALEAGDLVATGTDALPVHDLPNSVRFRFWMNQQRQSFGVVADGKNPVHVDGSIGKTKRLLIGQGTPHGDDFHCRRATPPELLSLRGYDA